MEKNDQININFSAGSKLDELFHSPLKSNEQSISFSYSTNIIKNAITNSKTSEVQYDSLEVFEDNASNMVLSDFDAEIEVSLGSGSNKCIYRRCNSEPSVVSEINNRVIFIDALTDLDPHNTLRLFTNENSYGNSLKRLECDLGDDNNSLVCNEISELLNDVMLNEHESSNTQNELDNSKLWERELYKYEINNLKLTRFFKYRTPSLPIIDETNLPNSKSQISLNHLEYLKPNQQRLTQLSTKIKFNLLNLNKTEFDLLTNEVESEFIERSMWPFIKQTLNEMINEYKQISKSPIIDDSIKPFYIFAILTRNLVQEFYDLNLLKLEDDFENLVHKNPKFTTQDFYKIGGAKLIFDRIKKSFLFNKFLNISTGL